VEEKLLERIVGSRLEALGEEILSGVPTWFTVHARLREAAQADTNIQLYDSADVVSVDQDEDKACVTTRTGDRISADIVIEADGHRSVVRQHVSPHSPDARFADYLIWLGVTQAACRLTLAGPPMSLISKAAISSCWDSRYQPRMDRDAKVLASWGGLVRRHQEWLARRDRVCGRRGSPSHVACRGCAEGGLPESCRAAPQALADAVARRHLGLHWSPRRHQRAHCGITLRLVTLRGFH